MERGLATDLFCFGMPCLVLLIIYSLLYKRAPYVMHVQTTLTPQ